MISFTVPGNPVPWQRAQSRNGQRFTAPKTRAYQKQIVDAALSAGATPRTGSTVVTLRFYRASAQPCDVDNLAKNYLDALNGIAYVDDRQVVRLVAEKHVDREHPRVEVEIDSAVMPAAAENALEGLKRLGNPKPRPRLVSSVRRPA